MKEYKSAGIEAYGYVFNVTDEKAVKANIEKIETEVGPIDILINNAGITKDNLLLRMSESDFDDVLNINLKGTSLNLKIGFEELILDFILDNDSSNVG